MKTYLKTVAVAAALLGTAAPAFAQSQLIANAGLTPAEAAGLSLNEIAVHKFSRGASGDDRQGIVTPGSGGDVSQLAASAGLTPSEAQGLSLTEIAAVKFNRDSAGDDGQRVERGGDVTAISRSAQGSAWAQLVAGAGLAPEEARGLSLSEIAAKKFDRDTYN